MSAFDARLNIGHLGIQLIRENEDVLAEEAELILGLVATLPISPQQAVPLPLGVGRVPLNRESVKGLIDQLTQAYDLMKDPSPIQVATSLDGVDKAVEFTEGLKG